MLRCARLRDEIRALTALRGALMNGSSPEGLGELRQRLREVIDAPEPGSFGRRYLMIALDLALTIAAGLPWNGEEARPGPVVYIAAEGADHVLRRADAWCAYHDVAAVPERFWWADQPIYLSESTELARLAADLRALDRLRVEFGCAWLSFTTPGNEHPDRERGSQRAA